MTEAPETQLTETSQTETAATEGETESETETETETESETEAEAPKTNHFAASFANGKADVTLSEAISEKAQFIAEQKSEESAYFDDALNIVGPWLDAKGLTILDAAVYDMHFEEDGKEIAVNQKANVNMQFASPILTMEPETGIQTQVYVLHIVNGNVEDAGSVTQNGAGAVTAATIHTNGFSPFVFVKVASGEPVVIPDGPIDLSNALYNAAISKVTYGGKTEVFDPNKQYPRDAKFTFELKYAFAENNKPTASGVRTAVYELPSCLSVVNATGTIECPGYAGSAGTYEIKNGVVTFVYEEAFLKAHPSDIKGTFNFEGALSNSATENKEEVEIDFNGSGTTIPITVKFEDGKVTGDKTYTLNADGTIDFTIRLKVTEKDVKNLVLTDTQGSNLEFANPPEFRLDGELLNPGQYTVSGNQMTLNLGDRTRGEYTLTYKAKVKDFNIKDGDRNKNSANWTWTGGSGSKDTTVQITESIVNKNGAVSNGEITWTVIYVPGNLSPAAGKTFTDTLGADQEYTGNYEVYYDSNGSQWWVGGQQIASGALSDITAADGKSFSYTFPSDQTANRGAYKLVYKTKITKDMSDIKDTVTFTNKIGGDGKEADGKVEVKPGEKPKQDIVKKSVVTDSENRKATWTITVTPPEGKTVKNLVIKDELQDFYNWKGKYEGTVTIKEAGSTLTEGTDYTVAKTAGGNGVNPTMTLVFSKEISGVLEITYTSDYTDSGSRSGWVGNKIHSSYTIDDEDNEEDDSASGEIKNTDFVLDKSGTLSGGIAKWEIIINDLQNWKRTDLPENTKTITDTLPEGMIYVDGSAKCMLYKENEENNPEETAITAFFDPSTRKLTMTVSALTGKVRAVITYDTKITKLPEGSGNGVTVDGDRISFTNSVTVGKKTKSATVTMTSKELHKVGKAVSGLKNVVEYVIDVNYEAMDLLPDSDVLVLEDVLDENLTLDTTSITVTDRDTGEVVSFKRSFSTLNDGKTKMVLTIPDSRALRVVYRATLVTAGKEDGKTYQVSNSATLKGRIEKSTETKTEVKYQKSDATVSGGSDSVSIQKVNEDGKSLKGATFVVRAVNPETLEDNPAYETMTATSDSNGMVTFEKLHYNTLYYYEETTAPTGYSRDTEKHYFIIKNIKDDAKKKEYEELKGKADEKNITLNEFTGGNTVIFENKKETTSRMVRKEWIQEDDIPANASVQVQLFGKVKDGVETQYGDTATLNAENSWRYTWENLPITDSNGNEITYSVKEVGESDGKVTISGNKFAVEIEDLGKEGFKIVNKKLIDISGSKTWDDNNNQDGKRPDKIVINLFADGTKVDSKEVTEANWSWNFTDLPKYKDAGTEIEYTITEDAVENYTTVVDGYNVTNIHIPATINISGGKHWDDNNNQDGKRPSSIKIRLYADDTELTDKVQTVTAADNWEWTFTNLPKYANGTEINYTITEDVVADYTTSVRGYNVTNTYTPEVVRVVIRKVWDDKDNQDGKRPTELKVDLKKKVGNSWNAPNELVQTITLNEGNGWQMEIKDLPKYADGREILYNWSEHTVGLEEKGYYFNSIVTEGEITTLTNTHVPEKVEASVRKVWNDNKNQDGKRPTDIIVKLYGKAGEAAAEEILKTTLNEANNWTFTKTDLPKFKDGVAYTYYWTEETQLPDYTVEAAQENSGNSFVTTLTNTHTPEKTQATVKKVWDDANNNDGKRPETIMVVLKKKNGQTETTVKIYELNDENGWTVTETGLDAYTNGVENEYSWEESSLPKGYSLESTDVNGTVTTLTNKYAPGKVSASVKKEWNDANNQDGIRPTSLDVVLKKNGKVYKTVTLNSENHWSYTVADLEDYTDGVKNIYTWEEVSVPEGYTSSSSTEESMTTLTNRHIPETVNATVYKVWDDNNNQDGIRPLELTVTLWRRAKQLETDTPSVGAAVEVKTVTLNQGNNWSAEETGLAKYTAGVENEYFWTEGSIAGYVLENGSTMNRDNAYITTLTNKHITEKTSATVEKRWRDNDNQDQKRPESITVILKKSVNGLVGTVDTYTLTAGADGSWKKTVDNLPKYENGTEIQYFWEESQEGLNGYQPIPSETANNRTLLVNAYTPEETSVSVQKVWNDDGNRDRIRPESITVTLYAEADGVAKHKVDEAVLNETNHWAATKSGLAKNVNGKPYTYTWEEENVPDGYTLTTGYDSEDTSKTILTNTHIPEKVEASVEKVWNDNNNQDGKRPTGITVKLYGKAGEAAAEEILETTLNEANNWKYTKTELPKFKNGVAYTYYWTEETQLPGYTVEAAQQNGEKSFVTTLTNTHAPEKTSATVEKRWRDNDNQDRKRPESITVILKKSVNGLIGTVDTYTLTAGEDGSWKKTVDDLPKYENGTEIQYFWEESQVGLNGYQPLQSETANNMTLLVNVYTPEETSVSVQKVWDDDGNRDGIRPESITVTLYAEADGVAKHKVDEAVLNETNHWAATKSGLAKNVNGKPYTYTWEEENVPDGYTLTTGYDSEDTSKTILTNTHIPETVNATVVKVWDDADNQDGKRPQDLTVTLMKNETVPVQTVTLDAANSWTAKVENLAKNENGTPIRYSWVEGTMPEGYSLESTAVTDEKNSDDVVIGTITTLTNTYAPGKVSASVKKVWDDANNQDGIRPETLRVNLLKNGQATDQFVILSEENRWSATLDNLDEYTDGTLNEYTWSEELPDGYTVTVSDPDEMGITTLTNTHTPAVIEASVEKTWDDNEDQDGKRPEKLLVTLMRRIREQAVPISLDDADTNPAEEVKTVELTAAHNWKASVSNLPKYKDGQMYEYFWTEKEGNIPNGYKLTNEVTYNIFSSGEGVTGFITTLTNTHIPQKINAIVKKVWDDNNNQDGKRAPELTVELMRNGTEVAGTVTLNEENNWTGTVENLDKYTGGVENVYTWVEKNLPEGYSLTETKKEVTEATEDKLEAAITTLTNSYTPGKVEASVLKVWNDGENQDGIRPGQITVILVKNNEPTTQSVTLSEVNHWTAAITGLDEYTNGTLNEYTWKEAEVPDGYTLTNTKKEGRLTTLTNTHTPEIVNATIRKTWNDSDNQDGVRPTEIKVDLEKNGQFMQTVSLNTENGWEETVEDLPKYTAGVENIYTWAEQEDGLPEGYELTGDVTVGEVTTLTNTRVPDTVSVGVRKIWNDAENQDGIRPSELRVDLLKNGELTGQYVILNEENGWTAMITDLPKNTAVAEPNVYTWSEELPDGYTVTVSDSDEMGITTLTNTHTPATIEASVEKTWDDNNNQDGKRPEKLPVTLMRRIREQAVPITLDDVDDADTNPAEEVKTVELTAANGWKASVSNQPKYKDGQMYEYFWTEKAGNIPDGYELTNEVTYNILSPGEGVTGFITTLTNTHTPEMTDISVTKVWEDNNNKAGVRPASIQVQLYADETPQGDSVELNEENSWKYTWKDLDKYADGTEISYRVDEVGETDGYLKSVAPNEDKTEYVITNTITSVKITKVDISDAHELEGAHLQILDSNGTVVAEWDSAKKAHEVTGLKTGELYTLRETVAPDGYTITTDTTFELDEYGKLKEDKTTTKTKDGVLLVEDTATSVKVRKVDITNDKELPGAHIQIWEKTGEGEKLVTEWDSTKEDKVVEKLKTNTTYILRETVAPDGYTITTDTTFELDEHGKLKEDKTTTNTKDGVLLVEDARTVEVSKVDLGTGEELDGAHIQVLDKAGNVVDEWDSKKGETHKVKNLTVGQEYTLRETVAPNGYTLTTDTTFTIDRTGKVTGTVTINKDGVLLVEDTATKAEITKLDAATEAPLSGAVLRVIDANGTAVDEWTTDGQPHVIEAKLNTGATYQLIEVKAPDGYEIADPISFTMKADGTTDPVVMKDAMTRSEKASVSVTKKLTFSGEEINAVDATFYVALYADEACTKRIYEIMPLVFKKASSATVTFTNVEIGRTYYVGECDANGVNFVSGVMAGNVAYAAIFANGNKATVTEADGTATVYFENQFATIPDGFYKEGILTITKKLLGSDKKAKNSNEVFYAGIFSDAAYTQLSGDVSENIVALDLAGGSEAEAEVFVAIAPGGSQTLYVTEVDANGKPVAGAAGFKYTVQVDKTSVTLSEANTEAHVTITNTETETETESETKKTTSVKTGDDTPIAPYMALMFASMAMLAAEFICRRKRRSEK